MIILNHFIITKHIKTLRVTKCFLTHNTFFEVVNMTPPTTKFKLQSPPLIKVILGRAQSETYKGTSLLGKTGEKCTTTILM